MASSDSSTGSAIFTENSDNSTDEHNPFLPTAEQLNTTYNRSKDVWQSCLEHAKGIHYISHDNFKLSGLLHQLPALPDDLEGIVNLQGQSTWKIARPGTCNLRDRTTSEQRWTPALHTGLPTKYQFSLQAPVSNWLDDDHKGGNNGIFVLLAGWAYILSKKLLEKQHRSMQFSRTLAPVILDKQEAVGENCVVIDIGVATSQEILWWSVLLAPGQGWRTTQQQPPWAIAYEGDTTFKIATTVRCPDVLPEGYQKGQPPSSDQAIQFLSRFSARYNLGLQSSIALAMTLTLPLHNMVTKQVQVPIPRLLHISSPAFTASPCPVLQEFKNISRYMTLSSNPRFLSSALLSIFWEPDMDCNLVSPWCDGILAIVEPLVQARRFELLAHVLAVRRPKIAALWYGAISFGWTSLIESVVTYLKNLNTRIPSRPLLDVAAWTGTPQSFMDLCGSGPYLREDNTISRQDVWRLRHDCWEVDPEGLPFRNTPLSGWPPFGTMRPEELELEVHSHVNCKRHVWQYDGWTWHLGSKGNIRAEIFETPHDNGTRDFNHHSSPMATVAGRTDYVPDNTATRAAVGNAFRWAATEIEVAPNNIFYAHSWVGAADGFIGSDEEAIGSSTSGPTGHAALGIIDWLEACRQTKSLVVNGFQSEDNMGIF